MVLSLTEAHLQSLRLHAAQAYPEECCGLLLGIHQWREGVETNAIRQVYATPNTWEQSLTDLDAPEQLAATAHRRYRIDPDAMLQAQRHARTNGWDIIGIYHSHPDAAAVPSEWDRAWAWPQYSYVIISVENGTARDLQSWCLDTHHEFLPERLMVSDVAPPQVTPNLEDALEI
ncbi:M67 family metallopeptidase [Altericista sp. CCNU0014]|uniref:M67 family metallopeptidase n=1 Tax=Altericista sp. CCNU0014 TaxID=3082949 RepID=UPI00384D59DA